MQRMGHASMRAALIYQHATSERDREIAARMDQRIAGAQGNGEESDTAERRRTRGGPDDDGTAGVLARTG